MRGPLWTGMKKSIASFATGSALCGALLLSGATSAQAARPDDRGPQTSVISTVALHNDTAENGSDCPNATKDWWHFVIAPNNDRYTITEMTLNLDGSAVTVPAGNIVGNGHQTDNVFVQVPTGSSLESLIAAGSSATVSGPDSNARLLLSHLCDSNDQDDDSDDDDRDDDDNRDDDRDDGRDDDRDDDSNDDASDDLPGNDDSTDNNDDSSSDDQGKADDTSEQDDTPTTTIPDVIAEEVADDPESDDTVSDNNDADDNTADDNIADDNAEQDETPTTTVPDIVVDEFTPNTPNPSDDSIVGDEIIVGDEADAPVEEAPAEQDSDDVADTPAARTPAPIVPTETVIESPAPEMPMLQAATAPEAPVSAAPAPQADATPAADTTTSTNSSGLLPSTGVSLLLIPALVLIGLGAAVRRAVARRV